MKRISILIFVICAFVVSMSAQKISVKGVSHLETDTWGLRNNRVDGTGKNCAVIRVGVVGINDMQFPDAVGNVARSGSEYIVYVPESLKALRYNYKNGSISGSVNLNAYEGVSPLVQGHSYKVVFETENHVRAAVFSVTTQKLNGDIVPVTSAKLTFDGSAVALDGDGMAIVEKPKGSYRYAIEASGFESQSGTVNLTEDEISTTTDILLEPKTYPLNITCTPPNASLFIDDVAMEGTLDQLSDLEITEGIHNIRLVAEGYDDYKQTINATNSMRLNVAMQRTKKVVRFTEERSRTRINVRPGFYLTGAGHYYDKKKYDAQQWGLTFGLSAIQHFAGVLAIREGIGYGWSYLDDKEMKNSFETLPTDTTTQYVDVPLQIGFSVPFGSYNRNLVSILGGGYGRYMWTKVNENSKGKKSEDEWDYGLRLSAILDIKHFTIGADVSTSLNGKGVFFGLNLGWKFY